LPAIFVGDEYGLTDREAGTVARGTADTLQLWARRPKSDQALALRSDIAPVCAEGASKKDLAAKFPAAPQMVGRRRARFTADRLAGLSDEEQPGRPRTTTDAQVERVVTITLEQAPPERARTG
jgi:transposase